LALGVPFAQKEMLMSVARLFLFSRFLMGLFLLLVGASVSAQTAATSPTPACSNLLHKTFNRLQDDAPQDLCQYAGRVLLIVNTASYCGFTSQYEGLEKLHADRKEKGLVVLGFPSNDFGQQEPGSSKQIAEFCANTYGVKFPMFEKSVVSGSGANQLYRDLAQATGKTPQWNFHKYLIGRDGKVVSSYASNVAPQDKKLLTDIDRALSAN
jgi:glutathione peroxidase